MNQPETFVEAVVNVNQSAGKLKTAIAETREFNFVYGLCLKLIVTLTSFLKWVTRRDNEPVDEAPAPISETEFNNRLAADYQKALIAELERRRIKYKSAEVVNMGNTNLDIKILYDDPRSLSRFGYYFRYLGIRYFLVRLHGRNGFEPRPLEQFVQSTVRDFEAQKR